MARWRDHSRRGLVAGVIGFLATLGACGHESAGPTNSEVVGQAAGISAVSIADMPTDRSSPIAVAAVGSRLVVYEGPAIGSTPASATARLWVFAPETGAWSDPLALDVREQLTGLRAVPVKLGAAGVGGSPQYLVVVGQRCPEPRVVDPHGELRCGEGPSALVAVTIALNTPVVGVTSEGPVIATFAPDGTVDGAPFVAPDVRWDGSQIVVGTHSPEGHDAGAPVFDLNVATGSFSAASTDGSDVQGLPVTCGRASHVARGVRADVNRLTVVARGSVTEVQDRSAPPDVLACSSGSAVLGPLPGLVVVDLASSSTVSIVAPAAFGPDSSVVALTPRQVMGIGESSIAVLSADRPPVTVSEGSFLPSTVCTDGADSYVRRQEGERVAFTHLINQR